MIDCVPQIEGPPVGARARRRGLLRGLLPALALSLGLAACASVEAPPAPSGVAAAAGASRGRLPRRQVRNGSGLIDAFGGEYRAPATEAYLNAVLVKIAQASDAPSQPYRVTLLNSPVVNAFALPSGDIFMTRGLIALADDTSEIAAVMAHEIAHVTARHAAQRAEYAKTTALFARVNAQVLERSQASRGRRPVRGSRSQAFRANRNSRPTRSASRPSRGRATTPMPPRGS